MFDVCVIGHVTQDRIKIDGKIVQKMAGGTAIYTAIALKTLGLNVAVLTKTSRPDRSHLLEELKNRGIAVFWSESPETTQFENSYQRDRRDSRKQRVQAVASPFTPSDLGPIQARIFHLGALTNQEMSLEFLQAVFATQALISLDGQGFLRQVINHTVKAMDWTEKLPGLAGVDILKVDIQEAQLLSGKPAIEPAAIALNQWGVREVLITAGSQGSWVYQSGILEQIPAFPPTTSVDPTGCGDTYIAGYLYSRFTGEPSSHAARFAAQVATRKLENFGPLREWQTGESIPG
ncbi:PfkB family carbohydrate kinase [Oscillatoria acuminata]|uniref:Sugar kinase, ribokinase n=1 Tax=Oscillatoria acuminata PCC 6304 TaxID=56110 RepID=K9TPW6_9CYAN|nr:PfkB family carbohydrate kinase [Oscillatoria acuminata]AFY84443.1 sugar kinase, ribokinase [Oscillatoria acuminata PCC 6304]